MTHYPRDKFPGGDPIDGSPDAPFLGVFLERYPGDDKCAAAIRRLARFFGLRDKGPLSATPEEILEFDDERRQALRPTTLKPHRMFVRRLYEAALLHELLPRDLARVVALAKDMRPQIRALPKGTSTPAREWVARYRTGVEFVHGAFRLLAAEGLLANWGSGPGQGWRRSGQAPSQVTAIAARLADDIAAGRLVAGDRLTHAMAAGYGVPGSVWDRAMDRLVYRRWVARHGRGRDHTVASTGFDWHPWSSRQLLADAVRHGVAADFATGLIRGTEAMKIDTTALDPPPLRCCPAAGSFVLFYVPDERRRMLLVAAGDRGRRSKVAAKRARVLVQEGELIPHRNRLDSLPIRPRVVVWNETRLSPAVFRTARTQLNEVCRDWQSGELQMAGIAERRGLVVVGLPDLGLLAVTGLAGDQAAAAAASEVAALAAYLQQELT